MSSKHKLGQYFTTNADLKDKLFSFILNKPSVILEPSIGQGDLVSFIIDRIPNVTFDMYEIDNQIKLLDAIQKDKVIYGDFMKQKIDKLYETIVGNPPYIRTKKGNMYIDFIEKCYNLLAENGELIFIVPSDFLKLTSSSKLLDEMMSRGTITHIFHPNKENLFEDASIDVIIFRYYKNASVPKKIIYNDKNLYLTNVKGFITFDDEKIENIKESVNLFEDYFNVYVGLVSGKETVFKNEELGNITLLNGQNKFEKYIYIEKFPSEDEKINQFLLKHKKSLLERKIRKFNENNWFEWGAPRNMSTINKEIDKDCIYMYNLTRNKQVAFLGKVGYFGGSLLMLVPKKAGVNLNKIVSYLNDDYFRKKFIFSGRFKIGHRQICNSIIPSKYV